MRQTRTMFGLLIVVLCGEPVMTEGAPDAQRIEMAKSFVNWLVKGEFEKAVEPFDDVMTKVLPSARLKQIWDGVIAQYGPFQRILETRTEDVAKYHIVYVTVRFRDGKLDTKVVLTSDSRITGLFFVPSGQYRPPAYADPSTFEESDVDVGKEPWLLPGTLSVPNGEGPFPAVVLVHGSGPNDRDETIGPNKPFRDLAHGLASQGIAVLRYEKRTKQHGKRMAELSGSLTVKEETVDDAVAAVNVLMNEDRIDARRIFVLGHSLGGNLIPRIGAATGKVAGFISLAGSTRPLEDVVLEQTRYVLSLDGEITDEEQLKIDAVAKQVERVKSLDVSTVTNAKERIFGAAAHYWLDLRGYDAAESARSLQRPMLILQGERDYQVTMADFARWKKALGTRNDVTLISYPELNHLFMAGKGKSAPAEYASPGNVADVVLTDIASWIKRQETQ